MRLYGQEGDRPRSKADELFESLLKVDAIRESSEAIQAILDMLHNPYFDVSELTYLKAQDVEPAICRYLRSKDIPKEWGRSGRWNFAMLCVIANIGEYLEKEFFGPRRSYFDRQDDFFGLHVDQGHSAEPCTLQSALDSPGNSRELPHLLNRRYS